VGQRSLPWLGMGSERRNRNGRVTLGAVRVPTLIPSPGHGERKERGVGGEGSASVIGGWGGCGNLHGPICRRGEESSYGRQADGRKILSNKKLSTFRSYSATSSWCLS